MFKVLLILIMALPASARLYDTDKQFIEHENVLANPSYVYGKAGWSVSTGSFSVSGSGLDAAATWDAGAASETFCSDAVAVPNRLKGKNGYFYINMEVDSGTATHTVYAYDGSNVLGAEVDVTSSTTPVRTAGNFIFPTSGNVQLCIESQADEPSIDIYNTYLGDAANLTEVKDNVFGSAFYPATASCQWVTSSGTYASFSADSDCPTPDVAGNAAAPATKIPAITLTDLPAGTYEVSAYGYVFGVQSSTNTSCEYRLFDGTTEIGGAYTPGQNANPSGSNAMGGIVTYDSYQSEVTIEIQGNRTAGNGACYVNASNLPLSFIVKKLNSNSGAAVKADQSAWLVDASISGANETISASAASDTPIENASWTMTVNDGSIGAEIGCASTEESSGTTCSSGEESLSVAFTPRKTGLTRVCFNFGMYASVNAAVGAMQEHHFRVVKTENDSQTVLETGKEIGYNRHQGANGSGNSGGSTINVCGNFNLTSIAKHTFRVFYQAQHSNGAGGAVLADADSSGGFDRDISVLAYPINNTFPAPLIKNSVVTSSESVMRVEWAKVESTCSANPCTIADKSGPCVSSIARNSTGNYTINFVAGCFSSAPSCTISSRATSYFTNLSGVGTATAVTFITSNTTNFQNSSFDINCIGHN